MKYDEEQTKRIEETYGSVEIYDKILELQEIEKWFTWYDTQVLQYERSLRLGTEFDHDIKELDDMAVKKAERIKQLREELNI